MYIETISHNIFIKKMSVHSINTYYTQTVFFLIISFIKIKLCRSTDSNKKIHWISHGLKKKYLTHYIPPRRRNINIEQYLIPNITIFIIFIHNK